MKIQGDYTFDAPRERVWEALLDPSVLTTVLPGCEKLDKTGEDAYEGVLNIKVGPVQGKFNGKIQLEDIQAPESYTMKVDGRGAPGFVKADAQVSLAEEGEATRMSYAADAQVGGRIASVGQRLLDSSAKSIIRQSLEGLNARIVADSGGGAEGGDGDGEDASAAAPPEPQPISQSELARNVAKDVAKDLVPKPVRIGVVVLIILALLYFIF